MIIAVSFIIIILSVIFVISKMQAHAPKYLPEFMRSWKFLPLPLRSLKPYDDLILKYFLCCKCCQKVVKIDPAKEKEAQAKEPPRIVVFNNKAYVEEFSF